MIFWSTDRLSVTVLALALLVVSSLTGVACGAGSVATGQGDDAVITPSTATAGRTSQTSTDSEAYIVERKSVEDREVFFIKQRPGGLPASAAGGGELVIDENGCPRMRNAGDGPDYLLVWPANFEMSAEGGEVKLLGGEGKVMARVGDEIRIGGAGISASEASFESEEEMGRHFGVPEACRRGAYWVVGEWVGTSSLG